LNNVQKNFIAMKNNVLLAVGFAKIA